MPNWVYGTVSITGDMARVQEVKNRLAQPYERMISKYVEGEMVTGVETLSPTFSFWNIVRPEGEDLQKYDESLGAGGSPFWYDWNCDNWGTKWDTDGELEEFRADHIMYRIETAWSPPDAALASLGAQYPDLHIELEYEEEQGWGGTTVYNGGTTAPTEWYDIPSSHADYVARDREDSCSCTYDNPFSDCPTYVPEDAVIPADELEVEAMI